MVPKNKNGSVPLERPLNRRGPHRQPFVSKSVGVALPCSMAIGGRHGPIWNRNGFGTGMGTVKNLAILVRVLEEFGVG